MGNADRSLGISPPTSKPNKRINMVWAPTAPELDCVHRNNAGSYYEEFTCLYPALQKFYLP